MSEERFQEYVWDVYYYSIDQRWNELRNILFLFTNECNSKSAMLLLFLAKNYDFEYLFEYMDDLRRGKEINLKEIEDECIESIKNGDLEFAKYLIDFIESRGKGTHQEVNMPYIKFAYNFMNYRLNNVVYNSLDDDLELEESLIDELNGKQTIKDIVSSDRLTSLKKEFMINLYNNIDTYTCTDRKGKYHIYAKVNEETKEINVEDILNKVDYEIYLGKIENAKEIVRKALVETEGYDPDLVRLYNKLFKDEKINRLERHICPPEVEDDSYNILYNHMYGFDNIDEYVRKALRNKQLDLSNYNDEEKGLIYLIVAREAYKHSNSNVGSRYLQIARKYIKYPEVNYFYNYVDSNKGNLNYQIVRSLPDAIRLELKK